MCTYIYIHTYIYAYVYIYIYIYILNKWKWSARLPTSDPCTSPGTALGGVMESSSFMLCWFLVASLINGCVFWLLDDALVCLMMCALLFIWSSLVGDQKLGPHERTSTGVGVHLILGVTPLQSGVNRGQYLRRVVLGGRLPGLFVGGAGAKLFEGEYPLNYPCALSDLY